MHHSGARASRLLFYLAYKNFFPEHGSGFSRNQPDEVSSMEKDFGFCNWRVDAVTEAKVLFRDVFRNPPDHAWEAVFWASTAARTFLRFLFAAS